MLNQIQDEEYLDMFDDDDTESESSDSQDDDIISIVMKSSDSSKTQKKSFMKKTNHEKLITDFDKEMEIELSHEVNALESMRKLSASGNLQNENIFTSTSGQCSSGPSTTSNKGDTQSTCSVQNNGKCEQYDDIYFDSDDDIQDKDSDTSSNNNNNKHRILSNDELFYDPELDIKDQIWMDERRRNPHMFSSKKQKGLAFKKNKKHCNEDNTNNDALSKNTKRKKTQLLKNRRAPKSDAILDCPACMTTLCIDCQKHATFPHQYRAMFVMNCTIDFTERFRYPQQSIDKRKKRKVVFNDEEISNNPIDNEEEVERDDVYYSVKCDECRTQVAMYDKEEIYHFFNVISSYG